MKEPKGSIFFYFLSYIIILIIHFPKNQSLIMSADNNIENKSSANERI